MRRYIRTRSSSTKKKLFNTLVWPHIEYAATVWDPHISKQKHSLEMVQRRAARWVTNRHHNTIKCVRHAPHTRLEVPRTPPCYQHTMYAIPNLSWFYLASHMIAIIRYISSHTDILHGPHVKQICTPSQHTSAGLTILNVLSSPKQLLLGMHSLKVWSLAPHWMHSRRHCHCGDRYQASVFEHTNLSCF